MAEKIYVKTGLFYTILVRSRGEYLLFRQKKIFKVRIIVFFQMSKQL